MKRSPPLRLEPRPSRIACMAITFGCAATALLVIALPLPSWIAATALVAVSGVAARNVWRCAGPGVPASIVVDGSRRISVVWRDGSSRDGDVLADTYVGACLTCIVWRPHVSPWWHPARALLFLPDTLPAEDFRRLRILLRYGIPETRGASSGV